MVNKRDLDIISRQLTAFHESVAVAESVTAGAIMNAMSRAEDATAIFQGGITAYNLGQKARHLGVDPIHADKLNCVSDHVAEQMALQVSTAFLADWGIGITGYAVPVPALKIRECFAFLTFCYKGSVILSHRLDTGLKQQARVQSYYVNKTLRAFAVLLEQRI